MVVSCPVLYNGTRVTHDVNDSSYIDGAILTRAGDRWYVVKNGVIVMRCDKINEGVTYL